MNAITFIVLSVEHKVLVYHDARPLGVIQLDMCGLYWFFETYCPLCWGEMTSVAHYMGTLGFPGTAEI